MYPTDMRVGVPPGAGDRGGDVAVADLDLAEGFLRVEVAGSQSLFQPSGRGLGSRSSDDGVAFPVHRCLQPFFLPFVETKFQY